MIDINNQLLGDERYWDLKKASALAEQAFEEGVREIVFNFRMKARANHTALAVVFEKRLRELREAAPGDAEAPLRISRGYEWELDSKLPRRIDEFPGNPTIGESDHLIVCLPSLSAPIGLKESIGQLIARGFIPVISHPECNRGIRANKEIIDDLVNAGCLIQIDAQSITGGYNHEIELFARRLLENRQVHFIASRARLRAGGEPSLAAAFERAARIIGRGSARNLIEDNPRALLSNDPASATRNRARAAIALRAALNS